MASQPAPKGSRVSMLAKIVLVAGVAALALGVYLVVGQRGRSESQLLLEVKLKELQEKEQKISTLEAEAAKTRQTLTEQTGQLSELKAKLEESQKELASVRVRLGLTNREVDRLASSRSQPARQTASRPRSGPPARTGTNAPGGGSRGLRNHQGDVSVRRSVRVVARAVANRPGNTHQRRALQRRLA